MSEQSSKPRFVQITATVAIDDDQELIESLYALDEAGGVWEYERGQRAWFPLSTERGS